MFFFDQFLHAVKHHPVIKTVFEARKTKQAKSQEEAKALSDQKAKSKFLGEKYGFSLHLQKIAEGGRFNRAGLTPIESAQDSNFWSAFSWLALELDKQD